MGCFVKMIDDSRNDFVESDRDLNVMHMDLIAWLWSIPRRVRRMRFFWIEGRRPLRNLLVRSGLLTRLPEGTPDEPGS